MKKLFLTFGIALLGFTFSFAQDSDILQEDETKTETEAVEEDLEGALAEKEAIAPEELPAAVSGAITTGAFEAMEIKEAFRVPVVAEEAVAEGTTSSEANYEVHMMDKEGQETVLTINEQGEIIATEQPNLDEPQY